MLGVTGCRVGGRMDRLARCDAVTGGMDSECHAIFSHDTDSFIDSRTAHGYPG